MKLTHFACGLICLASLLLGSCARPRSVDCSIAEPGTAGCPDNPAVVRADGGADRPGSSPGNPDPAGTANDAGGSNPATDPATDPGCQTGFHTCGGACVDSRQPEHCGLACVPCSVITGGSATCDGVKCGVACPAGKKPCAGLNACIGVDEPCDGNCPAGKNPCNGLCALATDKTACGSACAVCPTSDNGTTDCDGMQCTLTCNNGFHRCGDACKANDKVESCGASCTPCTKAEGGGADCVNGSCVATCPAPTVLCKSNGKCLAAGLACDGMCPAGKHECSGNCVPDTDVNSCGTGCTACSAPSNADATCDGKTCGFKCRGGYHQCGDQCKSNNDANACGASCTNCGANSACQNGQCVATCGNVGQACCSGSCTSGSCTNGRCCSNGQIWNGNACVTCNCNGNPHCGGSGVITETCNQSTGKCDQHTVQSCSGGRKCNGSSCECTPPQTFNGTSCVNPCKCTKSVTCDGNGSIVTVTGSCDADGACVKTTNNCPKGCTPGETKCNSCSSKQECPEVGGGRPGATDTDCSDCVRGQCTATNNGMGCASGGGVCRNRGCQACGDRVGAECCPGGDCGNDKCNDAAGNNICQCAGKCVAKP